jgi:hypothetical protein
MFMSLLHCGQALTMDVMLKRVWLPACVLATTLGCGGELRDPGRFAGLFDDESGAAGMNAGSPSAGGGGGGASGGGAGGTGGAMMFEPLPACVTELLQKCGTAACHGPGAPMVNLISSGVAGRLVDKPSSSTSDCKGRTLISTNGGESLFLDKLKDPPPCGTKMPPTFNLTDAQRTCMTNWVESLSD